MLARAIIQSIVDKYHLKIRIPVINGSESSTNSTSNEDLYIATVVSEPGQEVIYEVNDVVWVGFESNEEDQPVILGLLYRPTKEQSYSDFVLNEITANISANLPYATTIGAVTSEELNYLSGVRENIQYQIDHIGGSKDKILVDVITTYTLSGSNTNPPLETSNWYSSISDALSNGSVVDPYLWTRISYEYSDGTYTYSYSVAEKYKYLSNLRTIYIISSSSTVVPTTPTTRVDSTSSDTLDWTLKIPTYIDTYTYWYCYQWSYVEEEVTKWSCSIPQILTDATSLANNYNNQVISLKNQVDKKLNSYMTDKDPSLSWEESEKSEHEGDYWYYTGYTTKDGKLVRNSWYVYTKNSDGTYSWIQSPLGFSLGSTVNEKSTVYYGSVTYGDEDYKDPKECQPNDYIITSIGDTYIIQKDSTTGENIWVKVTDLSDTTEKANNAVKNGDVYYYRSSSPAELSPFKEGDDWQTTSPVWEDGCYIWTKTIWTKGDGTTTESNPTCITGNDGEDGESTLSVEIVSDNGNIFKSSDIKATLTCVVRYGTSDVTSKVTKFNWKKYNQDGTQDTTWSRMSQSSIYITNADVFSRASFVCEVDIDI